MKTAVALFLSAVGLLAAGPPVAAGKAPPAAKYKIDKRNGGKLFTTTAKLEVLAAPKAGSRVLGEYDKGAMMAVIGEATGTGYLYVSPCNACESGFVSKGEFEAKTQR